MSQMLEVLNNTYYLNTQLGVKLHMVYAFKFEYTKTSMITNLVKTTSTAILILE